MLSGFRRIFEDCLRDIKIHSRASDGVCIPTPRTGRQNPLLVLSCPIKAPLITGVWG